MNKIDYAKYPLLSKIIKQITGVMKMINTFEVYYQGKKIVALDGDKVTFDGESSPRGFLATSYYDIYLSVVINGTMSKFTTYLGVSSLEIAAEKAMLINELLYFNGDSSLIKVPESEPKSQLTIKQLRNVIRKCLVDPIYIISIEGRLIESVGIAYDKDNTEFITIETANGYTKEKDVNVIKRLIKIEKHEIIDINTFLDN